MKTKQLRGVLCIVLLAIGSSALAQDKPNILVIMGDDIGYWNLSHNNDGMMGYKFSGSSAAVFSPLTYGGLTFQFPER